MTDDWKNNKAKDPSYGAKRALAKEAILSGCWIYSRNSKHWYTPEEFMEADISIAFHKGKPLTANFAIMDPQLGLNQRIQLLGRTQQEIDVFSRRIFLYFEMVRKK